LTSFEVFENVVKHCLRVFDIYVSSQSKLKHRIKLRKKTLYKSVLTD